MWINLCHRVIHVLCSITPLLEHQKGRSVCSK